MQSQSQAARLVAVAEIQVVFFFDSHGESACQLYITVGLCMVRHSISQRNLYGELIPGVILQYMV